MPKPTAAGVILAVAVLTAGLVFGVLQWRASTATISAGFWFDEFSFELPSDATARLGGPLTDSEIHTIKAVARAEVERAFSGLRIVITGERDAFWRVRVMRDLRRGATGGRVSRIPISGESVALGPFGGAGSVNFLVAALGAVAYAPHDASRQGIIEGMGRGIGRAAVHEFGHAMVSANHSQDEHSYEYRSSDRASQYYGELHWASAGPLLQQRFGK
jgi:hypothetical protein